MTIKVGEKGQPVRIATNFDMSASTVLTIAFTLEGGTNFTVTNSSPSPVSAPAVALVNDPQLGNRAASTYFEYTTTGTEFDIDGDWQACAVYEDASRILNANKVTIPIGKACS